VASEVNSHQSSKPLLSSLTSSVLITPTLINQVNSAASSNPTLANLLQLAAAGKATPEQLKTLGLLIQSLANPIGDASNTNGTASSSSQLAPFAANSIHPIGPTTTPFPPPTLVREFDIVIEFAESSTERWILPRGPVICERILDSSTVDAAYDVFISTRAPFAQLAPEIAAQPATSTSLPPARHEDAPPQLVTFRLKRAPAAVWDTVSRWAGDDENVRNNRTVLEQLVTKHPLTFL
jgi:hypothetical protein